MYSTDPSKLYLAFEEESARADIAIFMTLHQISTYSGNKVKKNVQRIRVCRLMRMWIKGELLRQKFNFKTNVVIAKNAKKCECATNRLRGDI